MRDSTAGGLNAEFVDYEASVEVPLVSVVMLTYNHSEYIARAIEGVLMQRTDFSIELLIGEDCSSDGTREIARSYERLHPATVRVISDSHNVGMHDNHLRLLRQCRGEFIAYCEGDDYWTDSEKLARQVEYLRQHADAGAVHSNYFHLIHVAGAWRTRVAFRGQAQLQHRSGRIYEAMLQANRIQTCTLMCRGKLVEEYIQSGLAERGYLVEDWPLCLYLARVSSIGFVAEPLAAYRRTPGSMMNAGDLARLRYCLDAIRMVEEFCDFFDDQPDTRQESLVAQYRVLLWLAFRAGDSGCFDSACSWIGQNQPRLLRSARVRYMKAVFHRPPVRRGTLRLLAGIERIKHRSEFRKIGVRRTD